MRHTPRRDTRGILDPATMLRRVEFRRHSPAAALRPYVEHYWLIDWALTEPFEQQVLPHPSVNIMFRADEDQREVGEIAGVSPRLFTTKLEGVGRVSGVQFRPGGFRPFWTESVASLTGRSVPLDVDEGVCAGSDDQRCRSLDAILTGMLGEPHPLTTRAIDLVDAIRHDRTVLRVEDFAERHGLTVRTMQRMFADHVGVSPKTVILRYRLHEAIERASIGVDWAAVALALGYSDQAHLVRDFTATIGVSPSAYARMVS